MIPNITRGADFHTLLRYLVGPGRANEHTCPHLVGGDVTVTVWAPAGPLSAGDAKNLADVLAAPSLVRGGGPKAGAVWHCSLAVRAEDGALGDELWARIAKDFMAKMGWVDAGGASPMPWLAIHHGTSKAGNDHIHLVVSMVRDDGKIVVTHEDFHRAQQACRRLETELELTPLEGPAIGVGVRGVPAGELNLAARAGVEVPRRRLERIVRACAAMADTETQFVGGLRAQGVRVAPYYSPGGEEVTGYKVRLAGEGQRWFGGGRLARDLTLPRLRAGWLAAGDADPDAAAAWRGGSVTGTAAVLGAAETRQAVDALAMIAVTLRGTPPDRLATWGRVAGDLAGVLSAWSISAEGEQPGPLARAAAAASRLGQLHRKSLGAHPAPRTVTTGASRLAYQLGTAGQSPAATAILVQQVAATMTALHEAAKALGQARAAEHLAHTARAGLAAVTAALPAAPVTAAGPAGPVPTSPRPPAGYQQRVRRHNRPDPGRGSGR